MQNEVAVIAQALLEVNAGRSSEGFRKVGSSISRLRDLRPMSLQWHSTEVLARNIVPGLREQWGTVASPAM